MKKRIIFILACLLLLGLCACSSKSSSKQPEKEREAGQEELAVKENSREGADEEDLPDSGPQPDMDAAQGAEEEDSQNETPSPAENQSGRTNGTNRTMKRTSGNTSVQANAAGSKTAQAGETAAENQFIITPSPTPEPPAVEPEMPAPEPETPPEVQPTPEPQPNPEPEVPQPTPQPAEGKTLIVYFSWSSNTERMANTIREQTGGDLLELVPVNAYPADYTECTEVALAERDNDERPAIRNLPASIKEYDKILIGYPIWWHTAPMIIGSFLEHYDLSGIDVYPFTQSASMNREQFNNSMDFVRRCARGATVHDGLFVRASDMDGITAYLRENGLSK